MSLKRNLVIERFILLTFTIALTIAMQACTTAPTQEAVGKFAKAMDTTAVSVENGFTLVNANAVRFGKLENLKKYLETGEPNLNPPEPFLDSKLLAPRLAVIRGLNQYAQLLTAISNTDARERVQAASGSIAGNLISISGDLQAFKLEPIKAEQGQVANALNGIGQFLIDRTIEKDLPAVIEEMHPKIEKVVLLLKTDIGDIRRNPSPKKPGICGSGSAGPRNGCGLRRQLQISVENSKDTTENILRFYHQQRRASVNDLDMRSRAFKEAIEMAAQAHLQDAALAAIPATLDDLVRAHAALRRPEEQSTLALVEVFVSRAESLAPLFELAFQAG